MEKTKSFLRRLMETTFDRLEKRKNGLRYLRSHCIIIVGSYLALGQFYPNGIPYGTGVAKARIAIHILLMPVESRIVPNNFKERKATLPERLGESP